MRWARVEFGNNTIFACWRCGLMAIQLVLVTPSLYSQTAASSPPAAPIKSQTDTKELTDDLLDLLMKPPKTEQIATPAAPTERSQLQQDQSRPEQDPLHSVRQQMFAAAGMLQNGKTDEPTRQVQADIVKQLDELIEQLGRSSQDSSKSSDSRSSQSAQQKTEQTQREPASGKQRSGTQTAADQGKQERDAKNQSSGDQIPGASDRGELKSTAARNTEVQLADPRAMQQKVWGQLPDRVRQQMQSRMVEQFLPSFQEQINAYYRELAK